MSRIQIVCQVNLVSLGFDRPEIHVDLDLRPSESVSDWLQRRGRVARAWPMPAGDRSYQTTIISRAGEELSAKRNPLIVAGCGAGKSWIACKVAQLSHQRGKAIGFITPRRLLTDDISGRLHSFGVPHGIVMAGRKDNEHRTKVASVHTLASRGIRLDVDCLFLDEAHLYASGEFYEVVKVHEGIPRVLLTATPWRSDGLGLGRLADSMILGPSSIELQQAGFLVPPRIYSPVIPDTKGIDVNSSGEYSEPQLEALMSKPGILGNCVKEWLHKAKNLPTVAHCVSVKHAEKVAAKFQVAGVNAVVITADTPDAERTRVFDDMCAGSPPKKESILIDMAGNCAKRFGFPDEPFEWTLADRDPKEKRDAPMTVRRCEKCWLTFGGHIRTCPECGNPHVTNAKEVKEHEAQMMELKRQKALRRQDSPANQELFGIYRDFAATCKSKGYKAGWAIMQYKAKTGSFPPKWMRDKIEA